MFKELFTEGYEYVDVSFEYKGKTYVFELYIAGSTGRYQTSTDSRKSFNKDLPKEFLTTASGTPMDEYSAVKQHWSNMIKKRGGKNIAWTNKAKK